MTDFLKKVDGDYLLKTDTDKIILTGGEEVDTCVRITHIAGEVLVYNNDPHVRMSHIAGDVLMTGDPNIRMAHIAGEILMATEMPPTNFFLMF